MLFTDKIEMKKPVNDFDTYVYITLTSKDDSEYVVIVMQLNEVTRHKRVFCSEFFIGEYVMKAYAVSFGGHNSNIIDMYPTAQQIKSLENINYTGIMVAVDARLPNVYSTLSGSVFAGITRKYKGIPMGYDVYFTDFKKENRLFK